MLLVLDPFQNLHFSVRSDYYLSSVDLSRGYTFLFKPPRKEEVQVMVFHAEPGSWSPGSEAGAFHSCSSAACRTLHPLPWQCSAQQAEVTRLGGNLSSQINPSHPLPAQGWFLIAQTKVGAPKTRLDAKAPSVRASASETCSAFPSYFHLCFL